MLFNLVSKTSVFQQHKDKSPLAGEEKRWEAAKATETDPAQANPRRGLPWQLICTLSHPLQAANTGSQRAQWPGQGKRREGSNILKWQSEKKKKKFKGRKEEMRQKNNPRKIKFLCHLPVAVTSSPLRNTWSFIAWPIKCPRQGRWGLFWLPYYHTSGALAVHLIQTKHSSLHHHLQLKVFASAWLPQVSTLSSFPIFLQKSQQKSFSVASFWFSSPLKRV